MIVIAICLAGITALFCLSCSKENPSWWGGNYEGNYPNTEKYDDYRENPFIKTENEAVSTFAVDADGASYCNMRRFVNLGQLPPKASVRIEEYIN